MLKLTFGVLAIVAITTVMGTSMLSVDAVGKPVKTVTDTSIVFPGQIFCATLSTAFVNIHQEKTVDGDGVNWKNSVATKGELIEDSTNELIGTYHSKFVRIGTNSDDEIQLFNINIVINCLNGEKNENSHEGFTITKDGELHNHGPTPKE